MPHFLRITVERNRILPRARLEAILDCFNTPSRTDEQVFERLRALNIQGNWWGPNDTVWRAFDATHRVRFTVECCMRDEQPVGPELSAEGSELDPDTLRALQGSIGKWERIVAGSEQDRAAINCPLCWRFNKLYLGEPHERLDQCTGCPVARSTGVPGCSDTPYDTYARAAQLGDCSVERLKKLAQQELDFLKTLLPSRAAA